MRVRMPILSVPLISFAPRSPHEAGRGATPLELLFDLAIVVAIGASAHELAQHLADAQLRTGFIGFACSFFMIWWAWMNYTWFASAYDDDSSAFRGLTMLVMFGALMMAAGIDTVFTGEPIWLPLLGFVVMRLVMAVFWLGVARGDRDRRATARAYAGGIMVMQAYWIGFVTVVPPQSPLYLLGFALGAAGELAVPAIAERMGFTTWHRRHIMARYARLNLIVLGQCFIAIVAAIQLTTEGTNPDPRTLGLAVAFALVAFSMWSLYFADEDHLTNDALPRAFLWGYGHFAIFGAGAAAGAGMQVVLTAVPSTSDWQPHALTVPVAIYVAMLWLIRDRYCLTGRARWTLPLTAALLLAAGFTGDMGVAMATLVLVAAAVIRRYHSRISAAC